MTHTTDDTHDPQPGTTGAKAAGSGIQYVKVGDLRSEDDGNTCLRPLGLCELGGSCDSCWYRPDHPRFRQETPVGTKSL